MSPAVSMYRINYYVGSVLAQGGNIWVDESKIVFSPTSAIDRAMGAKDVHIPFKDIRSRDFRGDIRRMFTITTADRTHKFEGSNAKNVWDLLDKALPPARACAKCAEPLQVRFRFCPMCGTKAA